MSDAPSGGTAFTALRAIFRNRKNALAMRNRLRMVEDVTNSTP
jgi:hypothetical protein